MSGWGSAIVVEHAKASNADVAQLVAHHLAKVRVASSNLVIRSDSKEVDTTPHGGVAERRGSGLQSRLHGFESRRHLAQLNMLTQSHCGRLAQR